jgi:transposase
MPAERTTMRQVREVLRLKFVGALSNHEIARRFGIALSTVRATLKRPRAAGLSWPLPDDMTDAAASQQRRDARRRRLYRKDHAPRNIFTLNSMVLEWVALFGLSPKIAIESCQDDKNLVIKWLGG